MFQQFYIVVLIPIYMYFLTPYHILLFSGPDFGRQDSREMRSHESRGRGSRGSGSSSSESGSSSRSGPRSGSMESMEHDMEDYEHFVSGIADVDILLRCKLNELYHVIVPLLFEKKV